MMGTTEDRLDTTFAALANATRRALLARLAEGEANVNQLAVPFELSLPAISKHLKVLERAGLMVRGQQASTDRAAWTRHHSRKSPPGPDGHLPPAISTATRNGRRQ